MFNMINNQKAVEGIKNILSEFDDSEIFSLCTTVTQGLLKKKIETRKGALEAIIKYSSDSHGFLKRKAITREVLFNYLDDNNVKIKPPITKDKLISAILRFWDDDESSENESSTQKAIETHSRKAIEAPRETATPEASNTPESTQDVVYESPLNIVETNKEIQGQIGNTELDVMSLKFCEWFYSMMNENSAIGTEHFFPDTTSKIKVIIGDEISTIEAKDDVEETVNSLFRVKNQYNLFFNPNLSKEGLRGKMNPHGLVVIMCCGTLHVNNTIAGVFEQMFGLARDPFSENNWKVKMTELILRSKTDVSTTPRLCDSELPRLLEIKDE